MSTKQKTSNKNKMIEIRVRLWTDDISTGKQIQRKHAWDSGTVEILPNALHGINSGVGKTFNSLLGLSGAIEKALEEHSIQIHLGGKSRKYLVP
jgi:hypothetical protein